MCICVLFNLKRPAISALVRASQKYSGQEGDNKKNNLSKIPHYASKNERYANFAADVLIKSFFLVSAVMGSRWELAMLATYPVFDGIFMEKTTRSDVGKQAKINGSESDHDHSSTDDHKKDSCCAPKSVPHSSTVEQRIIFANEFLKTHNGYLSISQITSTLMVAAYATLFGAASISVSGIAVPGFVLPLAANLLADCYHFYNYSQDTTKLVDKFNTDHEITATEMYNSAVSSCCQVPA